MGKISDEVNAENAKRGWGPVLLKDEDAQKRDNEEELPKRRAAYDAWQPKMVAARKAAQAAEQEASRAWVAGFGHMRADLWREAAFLRMKAARIAQEGLDRHSFSYMRPGSLEYTQEWARFKNEPDAHRADAKKDEEIAKQAEQNEAKFKAKQAADAAASAKAAKSKAASDKRKATIAAKKAGAPAAPNPLKKWGGS